MRSPHTPHIASDLDALQIANQELAQAVANLQRSIDQLQQQQALQTQALLNVIRGRWDAAQFGAQSVESILVSLNPALHGKVNAIPFTPMPAGRQ
jgi:polyphosphate kinase 2 (PPK2 family)